MADTDIPFGNLTGIPGNRFRPATPSELCGIIHKASELAVQRLQYLEAVRDAVRDMHKYTLCVSHHCRFELSKLISPANGPYHPVQDVSDLPPATHYAQLVDFIHTKNIDDARNALLYDSYYSLLLPIDKLRPQLSLLRIRLDSPIGEIPETRRDELITKSAEELRAIHKSLSSRVKSVTSELRHTANDRISLKKIINPLVKEMRDAQQRLQDQHPETLAHWKTADPGARTMVLQKMIENLVRDGIKEAEDSRQRSVGTDDADVEDDSDSEDEANLDIDYYVAGWKIVKALVHRESFEDFEVHWQNLMSAMAPSALNAGLE